MGERHRHKAKRQRVSVMMKREKEREWERKRARRIVEQYIWYCHSFHHIIRFCSQQNIIFQFTKWQKCQKYFRRYCMCSLNSIRLLERHSSDQFCCAMLCFVLFFFSIFHHIFFLFILLLLCLWIRCGVA